MDPLHRCDTQRVGSPDEDTAEHVVIFGIAPSTRVGTYGLALIK